MLYQNAKWKTAHHVLHLLSRKDIHVNYSNQTGNSFYSNSPIMQVFDLNLSFIAYKHIDQINKAYDF